MPHILLRFMAIEDENKLKLSRRVASIWVVISMAVAVLIGVVGYGLMKEGIVPTYESASAAETIIVDISKFLSKFGVIPAFTAGIILAGILASTMSTADSQLLAAASSISQNLVQETFGVKLSEKKSVWLARISVIVISIIAIFLALDPKARFSKLYHLLGQALVRHLVLLCCLHFSGSAQQSGAHSQVYFRAAQWYSSGSL
jgi:sodium/proline symporter